MSDSHNRFVVGMFDDKPDAEKVTHALHKASFEDINLRGRDDLSGMTDYLERHGVPDTHSHYYAEGVRRGGHLVTVFTDDGHYAAAVELMRNHGAVDIAKRSHYYKQSGQDRHDPNAKPYGDEEVEAERQKHESHAYDESEGERVLPEIEEKVHIGKEKVERGGVRIFARETEVPIEKNVTLRDETIHVERTNVDRAATAEDLKAFEEGEYTLTETDEEAVVSKEARVTGEVRVGKTAEDKTETVSETAKKREIEVEEVDGDGNASGGTSRRNPQ